MAIGTPSVLRTASASAATVTTASFTPAAGALLKVDYGCRCVGSVPGTSTISGGGLTWTPVYEDMRDPGGTGNRIRLSAWTATATGAAMTVTCAASGVSRSLVAVTEITGAQLRQPAGTDTNGAGHPSPVLPAASQIGSVVLAAIVCTGSTITPPTGFAELSETLVGADFVLETAWDTGAVITGITWPTVTGNQGCVGAIMELEASTAASSGGFTENMALSDSIGNPVVAVTVGFTEAATTGDSVGSLGTSSTTSPENPAGVWSSAAASWKLPAGADSKDINALAASGITATTLQGPAGTFLAGSYARRTAPTFTALSAFAVEAWVQPTTFGRIFRIGSTTVAATTRAELRTNSDGSYTLTRTVGAATQTSSSAAGIATAAAQHVMAVFPSGANHLLYINGVAVTLTHAGAAVTGAIAISSTDEVAIGKPSPSGLTGMAGKIGRVTLWPFAASATRAAVAYRHQSDAPRWIGFSGENQAGETNRAPVAVPFRYTALPGVAKTVNVRARAYDPDGDTLNIVTGSLVPSTGTASLTGGDIVATAPSSFTGEQTVQFDLRDTAGKTSRAKIYGTVAAVTAYAWMHKPLPSVLPALDSDIVVWKVPAAGGSCPAVGAGKALLLCQNDDNEPIYGTINLLPAAPSLGAFGIGLTLKPRGSIKGVKGSNDYYGINAVFDSKFNRIGRRQTLMLANIDFDPRQTSPLRTCDWGDWLKFGTATNGSTTSDPTNFDEWMIYYAQNVLVRSGHYGFTAEAGSETGNPNDPHSDWGQQSRGGVYEHYFGKCDIKWGYQTCFMHGADGYNDKCHPNGKIFFKKFMFRSMPAKGSFNGASKYITNVGRVGTPDLVNTHLTAGNYFACYFDETYAERAASTPSASLNSYWTKSDALSPVTIDGNRITWTDPYQADSRTQPWMNGYVDFIEPPTPVVTDSEVGSGLAVRTAARLRELLSV